jgi:hypothetical protein
MFTWEIVMAYFMKNLMKNLKPRHGFKLWVSVGLFIRLLKVILKIINVHTIYQCLAHTYFFFFQVTFVVLVSFDYLLTSVQKLMVLVWNIILVIHVYIFLFPTINVCTLIIFNITFNKRINKPTETQSLKPCLG